MKDNSAFLLDKEPKYIDTQNEKEIFEAAWSNRVPLMLKGPTGSGKTRFIEHMAWKLKQPLITVSCHEDMTASDLVGRFLLEGTETVWKDGPLTRAVRYGGICYLDEIVEARQDTTVVIHSLTDDRRILPIEKTGEIVTPFIGTVYYPGIEEWEGGDLAVYTDGVDESPEIVKAKPNRLIIFGAGDYVHEVLPVTSGTRHAIAINLWDHQPYALEAGELKEE